MHKIGVQDYLQNGRLILSPRLLIILFLLIVSNVLWEAKPIKHFDLCSCFAPLKWACRDERIQMKHKQHFTFVCGHFEPEIQHQESRRNKDNENFNGVYSCLLTNRYLFLIDSVLKSTHDANVWKVYH